MAGYQKTLHLNAGILPCLLNKQDFLHNHLYKVGFDSFARKKTCTNQYKTANITIDNAYCSY